MEFDLDDPSAVRERSLANRKRRLSRFSGHPPLKWPSTSKKSVFKILN